MSTVYTYVFWPKFRHNFVSLHNQSKKKLMNRHKVFFRHNSFFSRFQKLKKKVCVEHIFLYQNKTTSKKTKKGVEDEHGKSVI
jgi:hypothetical protein